MPIQLVLPNSKLGFCNKLPGQERVAAAGAAAIADKAERCAIGEDRRNSAGGSSKGETVTGATSEGTVTPARAKGDIPTQLAAFWADSAMTGRRWQPPGLTARPWSVPLRLQPGQIAVQRRVLYLTELGR